MFGPRSLVASGFIHLDAHAIRLSSSGSPGGWWSVLPGIAMLTSLMLLACATPPTAPVPAQGVEPLRLSQVSRQGDATRLASFELVIQGLDADIAGEPRRAQGSYERAVQVDPTNPYAFLALARYHLDAGDSTQAIFLVDQAAALFESEGLHSPALGIHLIGLRGGGLRATGLESDGVLYLKRAEALAPGVWGDGFLSAEELK